MELKKLQVIRLSEKMSVPANDATAMSQTQYAKEYAEWQEKTRQWEEYQKMQQQQQAQPTQPTPPPQTPAQDSQTPAQNGSLNTCITQIAFSS